LAVIEAFPDRFRAVALAGGSSSDQLAEQIRRHRPSVVSVADADTAAKLGRELPGTRVLHGANGLEAVACSPDADLVVGALVGSLGLAPTLAAIHAGKDIALANKETLVVAGSLVTAAAAEQGVTILPVDSEHNAIHQALRVGPEGTARRLLLTASGGPFRTWPADRIAAATRADALAHPTWSMGPKITIDSATLMNKGLEIIEAHHLFGGLPVDVVVHPQSIVHSLVEYIDGTQIAQLAINDMRFPILYALAWPERLASPLPQLDLTSVGTLTFEPPDNERFPALSLARSALEKGGAAPAVLNAANEAAVAAFLEERIPFPAIAAVVAAVLDRLAGDDLPLGSLGDALDADRRARRLAADQIQKYSRPRTGLR
jgi:1-deoxy-D-xylulose-5-phosphate reductoisomerase